MPKDKKVKCPRCKSTETKETNVSKIDYLVCEYDIVCAKCGLLKDRYLYGHFNHLNFKDQTMPSIWYKFKVWLKSIFSKSDKKHKTTDIDYDDLPF